MKRQPAAFKASRDPSRSLNAPKGKRATAARKAARSRKFALQGR